MNVAIRHRDLRNRMERAIDLMIAALDSLDFATEDLEDGFDAEADSADDEPSLGAPEITDLFTSSDQTYWAKGGALEIDAEHDDSDDEPSLGSLGSGDPEAQSPWSGGGTLDFEEQHDGREPELGT